MPLFVDSFGNFIYWTGNISTKEVSVILPNVDQLPHSIHEYQVYAESLGDLSASEQENLIHSLGKKNFAGCTEKEIIDFASSCVSMVHLVRMDEFRASLSTLEFLTPVPAFFHLPSVINKAIQKTFDAWSRFSSPAFFTIQRNEWTDTELRRNIFAKVKRKSVFLCHQSC